ncbi:hypothetical protein E2C01_079447 [Portunus trituberculatus]|uniref:Uncharacterized protein n=1 Tax=Portunus trituberculatus TaxID=210409 RepID=A0A5B7IJK7_PORTR|nr:hypothetical protein [Portunus trituberculatus]
MNDSNVVTGRRKKKWWSINVPGQKDETTPKSWLLTCREVETAAIARFREPHWIRDKDLRRLQR